MRIAGYERLLPDVDDDGQREDSAGPSFNCVLYVTPLQTVNHDDYDDHDECDECVCSSRRSRAMKCLEVEAIEVAKSGHHGRGPQSAEQLKCIRSKHVRVTVFESVRIRRPECTGIKSGIHPP